MMTRFMINPVENLLDLIVNYDDKLVQRIRSPEILRFKRKM